MLFGLSLSRPWPWAFTALDKRVENRTWRPPARAIGHWLALHAAKSWDAAGAAWLADHLHADVPENAACPASVIVAVCRLGGYVETADVLPPAQQRWFFGPYAWLCPALTVLQEPVGCPGARGLWSLEDQPAILAQVRAAYARSRPPHEAA